MTRCTKVQNKQKKRIRERDGNVCSNPKCKDTMVYTHRLKQSRNDEDIILLCLVCHHWFMKLNLCPPRR